MPSAQSWNSTTETHLVNSAIHYAIYAVLVSLRVHVLTYFLKQYPTTLNKLAISKVQKFE